MVISSRVCYFVDRPLVAPLYTLIQYSLDFMEAINDACRRTQVSLFVDIAGPHATE